MRPCARSGCSSPAVAILTYDREALIGYLVDADDASTRTPGDLCERHVGRLVLPRDWTLDDRRATKGLEADASEPASEAAPVAKPRRVKLRSVPTATSTTPGAKQKAPRAPARRKWAEVEPSLFDAPTPEAPTPVEAAVAAEPDDDDARYMPRFGPESDLDEVLDAKTPMLRRAFGGV